MLQVLPNQQLQFLAGSGGDHLAVGDQRVQEGQTLARLKITRGNTLALDAPLLAAESIEVGPIYRRAFDAVRQRACRQFGKCDDLTHRSLLGRMVRSLLRRVVSLYSV